MSESENQKLIGTVNDSSKSRGILPETEAQDDVAGGATWLDKAKAHRGKIAAGAGVVLLALILGLTLGSSSPSPPGPHPKPGPTPGPTPGPHPGPTPPVPPTPIPPVPPIPPLPPVPPTPVYSVNPYYVARGDLTQTRSSANGVLSFNETKFHPATMENYIAMKNEQFAAINFTIDPQTVPQGVNNPLIKSVAFDISQVDAQTTRLHFTDGSSGASRWNPPADLVKTKAEDPQHTLDTVGFALDLNPFGFEMRSTRLEKDALINMTESDFVMSDKYLQIDLQVPTQKIFGFGERESNFLRDQGAWTLWANGQSTEYDAGHGGAQTYGVHPFALVQTEVAGEFFGLYFRNTNAASPVIRHKKGSGAVGDNGATISYITTGGEIELFVFTKGDAKAIIQQYQNFVGKPALPPVWALGWHQVTTPDPTLALSDVEAAVASYKAAEIPLESVWLDRTYMDNYQAFTVDATKFKDIETFTSSLHNANQKLMVVVGPGISSSDAQNVYYSEAVQKNLLIKSSINTDAASGDALTQVVWPGLEGSDYTSVFLDLYSQDAAALWHQALGDLHAKVPFDGLWLDMNEATGVCNGECPGGKKAAIAEEEPKSAEFLAGEAAGGNQLVNGTWYTAWADQSASSTYTLPFIPGQVNLDNGTLSLNATHPSNGFREYDVHNLFGHLEGKVTREFFTNATVVPAALKDQLPFIISRSTFAGSGAYVASGLGANTRTWDSMIQSVAQVYNFNMFGIPMTGTTACGYSGVQNDEMCARWIQQNSFFPLAKVHRATTAAGGTPNEPYNLSGNWGKIAAKAIRNRLQFINHMYTCLLETSLVGGTCVDPMFYHYPADKRSFDIMLMEKQFIVGDSLMVIPISQPVTENGDSYQQAYFPQGYWVNVNNFTEIIGNPISGTNHQIPVTNNSEQLVPTYLREGYMVLIEVQNPDNFSMTTKDVESAPLHLVANQDLHGWAKGRVSFTDGKASSFEQKQFEQYEFHLSAGSLKKWDKNPDNTQFHGRGLDAITIVNMDEEQGAGIDFACWVTNNESVHDMHIMQMNASKTITFLPKQNSTIDLTSFRYMYYGNSQYDQNLCFGIDGQEKQFYKVKDGQTPDLSKAGPITVRLENNQNMAHPDLDLTITVTTQGVVNIQWDFSTDDPNVHKPWRVPTELVNIDMSPSRLPLNKYIAWQTKTGAEDKGEFFIRVMNPKDNSEVFTLRSNLFLVYHLNTWEATAHTRKADFQGLMGLPGQTTMDLFLADGTYSLWNKDVAEPVENGRFPATNSYSSHPFVMGASENGDWFGVYSNVANAQDWVIHNQEASGDVNINFLATGGRGDISVFSGDDPNEVVRTYHSAIVGLPVVTPQWALGFHQSRWGYKNTADLQDVVWKYGNNSLPLESIWSDIDYMNNYKNFEIDALNFHDLGDFVKEQNLRDRHWVPIVDAAIAQRVRTTHGQKPYLPYLDGVDSNIFIKASSKDEHNYTPITGRSWPGDVVFPDFFNNQSLTYWSKWLGNLHDQAAFSGIWLDMNEPSSFCTGACYYDQQVSQPVQQKLKVIPSGMNLEDKTIPLDSYNDDGSIALDTHNVYGSMQAMHTHDYFQYILDKRPMIIGRSTFAGYGKYASKWLGDNFSTSQYMGMSVLGVMADNIAGIPLSGADICGFNGNTTTELCGRWYTIGAFYPFSRNHNSYNAVSQEPYLFDHTYDKYAVTWLDIIRNAMQQKMSLIRYYYSELSHVQRFGGAFFRPLFFDYPNDGQAIYSHQNRNVMLGSHIKLGLLSDFGKGTTNYDLYTPKGLWCDIFGRKGTAMCVQQAEGGTRIDSQYPWDYRVQLREGSIIPVQNSDNRNQRFKALTTRDLQNNPIEVHILPNCTDTASDCVAQGIYHNDDGETTSKTEFNRYQWMYSQPQGMNPATVTFSINNKQTVGKDINANDWFYAIQIYNAAAWGMNTSYTVEIFTEDGKSFAVQDANYDQVTDRLVYDRDMHSTEPEFSFVDIDKVVFTRKASD